MISFVPGSAVIGNAAQSTKSSPSIFGLSGLISSQFFRRPNLTQICSKATLNTVSKKPLLPPVYRRHKKFDAMKGNPQRKGIIVKLLIKKPKVRLILLFSYRIFSWSIVRQISISNNEQSGIYLKISLQNKKNTY